MHTLIYVKVSVLENFELIMTLPDGVIAGLMNLIL